MNWTDLLSIAFDWVCMRHGTTLGLKVTMPERCVDGAAAKGGQTKCPC